MTLQPFNYIPADTLQTAEALLREHGEKAAVIVGGTDLLGALKDAIHDNPPELLIGLKPVTALCYVTVEPAGVKIGALTTLAEIAKHPAIRQGYPLLAEAARQALLAGRFATSRPSPATSARSPAAGTIATPTTPSTACARVAGGATRRSPRTVTTPSSAACVSAPRRCVTGDVAAAARSSRSPAAQMPLP